MFGPTEAGHYVRFGRGVFLQPDLANREPRTPNRTPNLNTNREGRTRKSERHVLDVARHLVGDAAMRIAAETFRRFLAPGATPAARNRSLARRFRLRASSRRLYGIRPSSTAWTSASSAATCDVDMAGADQQTVAAGGNRLHGGIRHRVGRRDRFHFEVIAEDDALETQLVAQQVVHDAARQRRRPVLVQSTAPARGPS